MKQNSIKDMKTSQFPFGQYAEQTKQNRKILIKKRVYYKNEKEHKLLEQKINILKNIYHKNAINFREVQDNNDGTMDVYYNYVPYSLESFFQECSGQVIKEIHRQLIKLVIHMAKNCLLTSFNPSRCGVLLNADGKWQLKYYLPLKEIVVTNDVTMLERSVQLFTVQSLHFLDSMASQYSQTKQNLILRNSKNTDIKYRSSFQSLRNAKRDSQPYSRNLRKQRRFSNQTPFLQFSKRKLSIMSRQKSQFSNESLKQTNSSTMFQTIRSSSPGEGNSKKCDSTILTMPKLKPLMNVIQRAKRANSRSRRILKVFNSIIQSMKMVKQVNDVIDNIQSMQY